jgi:DNA helicase II / ATP-dependent DNA helicase PcrA
MDSILSELNPRQREAVLATEGPLLILAGAGSGKTKALTHRIAYLIAQGVKPENILAITFTNKAADEMRERVNKLLKRDKNDEVDKNADKNNFIKRSDSSISSLSPYIGTFHAFCVRILRNEATKIGHTKHFTIYDEDDSLGLTKEVMKELDINIKQFPPGMIHHMISRLKSECIAPDDFEGKHSGEIFPQTVHKIYERYQKRLRDANALDFDDLIMAAVRLFETHPDVLETYQNRFQYIHIDEYQDTNTAQYRLIRLLAQKHRNLAAVGDDAQSIYSFRNADFRNILNFEQDWPDAKIIILDENYRSTKRILDAANRVIGQNIHQKQKNLWTQKNDGALLDLVMLPSERTEAKFIVTEMETLLASGKTPRDFVVLYRTNAQSRVIEEALLAHEFPYKIIGGIKFYARKEVKDIVAYLRFLANPRDIVSLKRIINVPPRGIGTALFLKYTRGDAGRFTEKERANIGEFKKIIAVLKDASDSMKPSDLITFLIKKTKYEEYLKDASDESASKIENIRELKSLAKKFDALPPPDGALAMLEEIALIADQDAIQKNADAVHLMTLHAAKGLEFPIVFIAGLEDGIFPHAKSLFDPNALEEERRLCYVGITRAKEKVYLCGAFRRTIWGERSANPPSRFLSEIPQELIKVREDVVFDEEDEDEELLLE